MKDASQLGGGEQRIISQHNKGKLTARERIIMLLDRDSFTEVDEFVTHRCDLFGMEENRVMGDGVVTGYGKIDGRIVYVFAHDFTVFGGALGEMFAKKISKIMDMALMNGAPIIGFYDSGGARIQEGLNALDGYGQMFYRNVRCSGVVPQITAIVGPCAGGSSYSPALTDFVFQVEGIGKIFITGPEVVRSAIGEQTTMEDLGGAKTHGSESGVSHFVVRTEEECCIKIRTLLSYLPSSNREAPPRQENPGKKLEPEVDLDTIVPTDNKVPYDMMDVIRSVADDGSFFEVHELWAKNIIVGLARMDGSPIGIIAQQPLQYAGSIDVKAARKASRFIRFCDAFNIPIITFVDVPGFYPGLNMERQGIIREGAKLLYAYADATVPRITITTRKGYGGAQVVMNSKSLCADFSIAWPTAKFAVMGPEGAVNILYKKKLEASDEPDKMKSEFIENYRNTFASPYIAARMGLIDEVIYPRETRDRLIRSLESLRTKQVVREHRKHGNIPL